jgi:hypothetical protein
MVRTWQVNGLFKYTTLCFVLFTVLICGPCKGSKAFTIFTNNVNLFWKFWYLFFYEFEFPTSIFFLHSADVMELNGLPPHIKSGAILLCRCKLQPFFVGRILVVSSIPVTSLLNIYSLQFCCLKCSEFILNTSYKL